jgi:hypothetical protein
MDENKTNSILDDLLEEVAKWKTDYDIDLTNISEANAPYFENAMIEVMKQNPNQGVEVVKTGTDWAAGHHPGGTKLGIHFNATGPRVINSTLTGLLGADKIRPQDIVKGFFGQSDPQKLKTLVNYFENKIQQSGGWERALANIEGITDEDDPL